MFLMTPSVSEPQTGRQSNIPVVPPADSSIDEENALAQSSSPQNEKQGASPKLHCLSAILIDAATGQILYAMNADKPLPMASTTKIMTALVFCERVSDKDVITVGKNPCQVHDSSLHLKLGEKLTAHDLLRGILMRSANDGCVAAAEKAAGSESAFVELMNERAAELGATNTHFVNPHGLHNPNHYTTAHDLAIIAQAALLDPRIREVVRMQKCRISRSKDQKDVVLSNHSHFLGHFPGADGVKTGWTIPAGHCYVGSATWKGWQLISVVLKSQGYVNDTAALMKYGFYHFERQAIAKAGENGGDCPIQNGLKATVPVLVQRPVDVVTKKGLLAPIERRVTFKPISAPIQAGTEVGTLEALIDNRSVSSSPLVAAESVAANPVAVATNSIWKPLLLTVGFLGFSLVGLRNGKRISSRFTAFAKSARRRGRRIAQVVRDHDRGR